MYLDTGVLTKEDKEKIIAWLTRDNRPAPQCPICGTSDWSIADHLIQAITLGARNNVNVGGIGYPNIAIVSTKCGYTMYVNAVMVGILEMEKKNG